MNILREYIRGLLSEATKHDTQFKTLMDAGYDGIKQAMQLADHLDIPSQELPWTEELIADYLYSGTASTGRSAIAVYQAEYDKLLANTGWTYKEYRDAWGRKDARHQQPRMMREQCLREYIREMLNEFMGQPVGAVDGDDPRPTPSEEEFVTGQDVLAGYILVRDAHDNIPIAYAPITQTDGPDRPFLVRTTDTKWIIPFGIVRALYPQVEDAFNWVDSKEDWRDLGVGSRGDVGNFSWEWVENEPVT